MLLITECAGHTYGVECKQSCGKRSGGLHVHIMYLLQSVVVIHTVWGVTRAVVTVVVVHSVIM